MENQIATKLEELRGHLQHDGGDLEIVEIKDKDVKLRLTGACKCCPHAAITIKDGIEKELRGIDPEITVHRVE